ncbi:hypothetical protein ABW21_db0206369 [Orbilia brochopaga]|nr:hypothetical protein ABW21_db0206369 [Drechslerella brochopaga]
MHLPIRYPRFCSNPTDFARMLEKIARLLALDGRFVCVGQAELNTKGGGGTSDAKFPKLIDKAVRPSGTPLTLMLSEYKVEYKVPGSTGAVADPLRRARQSLCVPWSVGDQYFVRT